MKIRRIEDQPPEVHPLIVLRDARYTIELSGLELAALRQLARKVWGSQTGSYRVFTQALATDPIPGIPDNLEPFFDVATTIGANSLPSALRNP